MKSLLKTLATRARHLAIGVTWSSLVGAAVGCMTHGSIALAFTPAMLAGGLLVGAFAVPVIEYLLFQAKSALSLDPQWYDEAHNIVHY
ncbi:hypothetical protein NG796_17070 [Laspinema sp. A4]|uniref:hypothetical protein n=1 Tax=Laspinema sp. D2d TaxID=2953686 RepID=UPI0021BB5747|nr:hypothetical protein [Laspinema sp. D2d]MCT7984986.1 hypothetical protein [Laspinema sp. D2d]